jgi:hypothetical protein
MLRTEWCSFTIAATESKAFRRARVQRLDRRSDKLGLLLSTNLSDALGRVDRKPRLDAVGRIRHSGDRSWLVPFNLR